MSSNWYFWLFKQSTLTVKTQPTSVFFKALTFGKVQIFKFIHVSDCKRDITAVQCNSKNKVHRSHLLSPSWCWSCTVHHVIHYLLKPAKSCHLRVNPITHQVRWWSRKDSVQRAQVPSQLNVASESSFRSRSARTLIACELSKVTSKGQISVSVLWKPIACLVCWLFSHNTIVMGRWTQNVIELS